MSLLCDIGTAMERVKRKSESGNFNVRINASVDKFPSNVEISYKRKVEFVKENY
jgi:hypothetical protein